MITTVQFNNQLSSDAGKIGEKRTDRVLPSELQAAQTFRSDDIPKKRFCFRLTLAEFTSAIGGWIGGHDRPLNRRAKCCFAAPPCCTDRFGRYQSPEIIFRAPSPGPERPTSPNRRGAMRTGLTDLCAVRFAVNLSRWVRRKSSPHRETDDREGTGSLVTDAGLWFVFERDGRLDRHVQALLAWARRTRQATRVPERRRDHVNYTGKPPFLALDCGIRRSPGMRQAGGWCRVDERTEGHASGIGAIFDGTRNF